MYEQHMYEHLKKMEIYLRVFYLFSQSIMAKRNNRIEKKEAYMYIYIHIHTYVGTYTLHITHYATFHYVMHLHVFVGVWYLFFYI